MKSNDENHLSH